MNRTLTERLLGLGWEQGEIAEALVAGGIHPAYANWIIGRAVLGLKMDPWLAEEVETLVSIAESDQTWTETRKPSELEPAPVPAERCKVFGILRHGPCERCDGKTAARATA